MTKSVHSGARFSKHRKRGESAYRWVLINKDRLFWKENKLARNQRSRSMHLAKIVKIKPGKQMRALKNAQDVDEQLCFSIVSNKHVTLDLSGDDVDTVHSWIVYLNAFGYH